MNRDHRLLAAFFLVSALLLSPAISGGQELYTYTVDLLGGIGGSPDVEQGDGFDNTGLQVNLSMVTEPGTHVGVRVGKLGLDSDEFFGSFEEAELSYLTLAGEYRFPQTYYESGIYIGLGGYRLEGTRFGEDDDDTAPGLSLGVTGEFKFNRWLGLLIELSGHYVDFDEAQLFGMAHGGLSVHF
ncbi:MAG TPA: hypothetical protein VEL74_00425 [Thermoanaerobaculia bacterium]|nr:hypothetical protein [Thermoanaerobaculia bacterium]